MANIVIELQREISRVEAGLEKLESPKRSEAALKVTRARGCLASGIIENFYDALDDLRGIEIP